MAQSRTPDQISLCTVNLTITVYDQSKEEQSQKQDETPVRSPLGQAQRRDEALSKLIEWIEKGEVLTPQELQGLPKLTLATQQPIQEFTTLPWKFVPQFRNRRQDNGFTTNRTTINYARNLIIVSFIMNCRTLRNC